MAGSSAGTSVDLAMTAGIPYSRRIRVTGGAAVWPTVDLFEVRSQVRAGRDVNSAFLHDLAQYMTPSISGADIVVDLELSGEQTRELPFSKGNYDVVLSDPGIADVRAIPAVSGKIKVGQLITAAQDE